MAAGASVIVVDVDRAQRLHQRGDRLHEAGDAEVLAVGDAALEAARAVRRARQRDFGARCRHRAGSRRAPASPAVARPRAPRPIPTALIAGIDIMACARRPSSLRSHCTWLPRPIGTPDTITSNSPPSVSPAARAASIAAIIAAWTSSSTHRKGESAGNRCGLRERDAPVRRRCQRVRCAPRGWPRTCRTGPAAAARTRPRRRARPSPARSRVRGCPAGRRRRTSRRPRGRRARAVGA